MKIHIYHHDDPVVMRRLETIKEELMAKITEATDRLVGLIDEATTEISKEIQQVKDAIAAGDQSEANAAADRLTAAGDKLQAAVDSLKADDPVEAPPPETPPPG